MSLSLSLQMFSHNALEFLLNYLFSDEALFYLRNSESQTMAIIDWDNNLGFYPYPCIHA